MSTLVEHSPEAVNIFGYPLFLVGRVHLKDKSNCLHDQLIDQGLLIGGRRKGTIFHRTMYNILVYIYIYIYIMNDNSMILYDYITNIITHPISAGKSPGSAKLALLYMNISAVDGPLVCISFY